MRKDKKMVFTGLFQKNEQTVAFSRSYNMHEKNASFK
jgi:hypothetical protein